MGGGGGALKRDGWNPLTNYVSFLGGAPTSVTFFIHLFVCLSVCRTPYLRKRTSSNHHFWYTHVKWWYLQVFFYFSEILIFWAVKWVKGQKIAQYEKSKLHLSHAISQEQYSIWSWFLVLLCKMMTSPGVF